VNWGEQVLDCVRPARARLARIEKALFGFARKMRNRGRKHQMRGPFSPYRSGRYLKRKEKKSASRGHPTSDYIREWKCRTNSEDNFSVQSGTARDTYEMGERKEIALRWLAFQTARKASPLGIRAGRAQVVTQTAQVKGGQG